MCIMMFKPHDVDLLSMDTYHQCWRLNDDGGSIAVWDKDKEVWRVWKGLMTWPVWKAKFEELESEGIIGKDKRVFIHFRVGTAAANKAQALTHPFPLKDDFKLMGEPYFEDKYIIAHNGTIGPGNKEKTASDTMLGVQNYIEPLWDLVWDKKGNVINKKFEGILETCLDTGVSRWFITHEDHCWMYGPWIEDKELGTWFSNDDYEDPWKGFGGAYSGNSNGGWGGATTGFLTTKRNERQADIDMYLDQSGDWSWAAWTQLNSTLPKPEPDNDTTVSSAVENMCVAILDDNGDLHWDDDEEDFEYICCPDCASDQVGRFNGNNLCTHACTTCGAMFDGHDGDVIANDHEFIEAPLAFCMYCNDKVIVDTHTDGNTRCANCQAIIDVVDISKAE